MGYDINRFDRDSIPEDYICPICRDVLAEPLMVDNCEHIFCSDCIFKWINREGSCPVDRNRTNASLLRQPMRSFRNLLGKLIIKCDFEGNGCDRAMAIDDLLAHVNQCKFNPDSLVECPRCQGKERQEVMSRHECVIYLKRKLAERDESTVINRARNFLDNPVATQTEMSDDQQAEVIKIVSEAIRKHSKYSDIANYVRGKLDSRYGGFWAAVVGHENFAAFYTADVNNNLALQFTGGLKVRLWKQYHGYSTFMENMIPVAIVGAVVIFIIFLQALRSVGITTGHFF